MKRILPLLISLVFGFSLTVLCGPAQCAPDSATLQITTGNTLVTTALAVLSKSAGVPILADSTVINTIGPTSIKNAPVESILNNITTQIPALSWTKVYLPSDLKIFPSADDLSNEVRTIKTLPIPSLTIATTDPNKVVTIMLKDTTSDSVPEGMQVVYLVTNEAERAAQAADAKTASAKEAVPTGSTQQTAANMGDLATNFSHLSPQDQAALMPQLMDGMRDMMMNMSPQAKDVMKQQFMQWRQAQDAHSGANGQ